MEVDSLIEKICQTEETYSLEVLHKISNKVTSILLCENNVLALKDPIRIVGDIHGQFFDLLGMFNDNEESTEPILDIQDNKYLFLGDYVDRGNHSIKVITLLLLLKIKFPKQIYLLRGNHETRATNQEYGFYEECKKFFNEGSEPWKIFNDIFDHLPISAIVNEKYFCVHGGISPSVETIFQLKKIDRFKEVSYFGAYSDLIWSDPDETIKNWKISPRGSGYLFGEDSAKKFLDKNDLEMIIRSHQTIQKGWQWHFDLVYTIWSAPNYNYSTKNEAYYLQIKDNKLRNKKIKASPNDHGHSHFLKINN
ncbi:serine/threonine-protein phosphatase pp2a-like ppg1 [Anaeramoeba flamelloides]|uniref:Serine/threonine-protein phosphatase n=1 Tax=Anaeramoeba flamelloides TaxID=1746091 RepID=A0AAV8AFM3_9EUKA|nr:serine/threonine-protein phosphatase pp2a-like ppg1 [Anaeramoeba flamelloides]